MRLRFSIDNKIFEKFPKTNIGYVVAAFDNQHDHEAVARMKQGLQGLIKQQGITEKNLDTHPEIMAWREAYKSFGVKPKDYRSSVESLVKRVSKGQNIWNISTVVDLYNVQSVESMFPMGGYDLAKLQGDLVLRYGNHGEEFLPLGQSTPIPVKEQQVIYSDGERVICWLWNHKDSESTCIDKKTNQAIFFIDSITLAGEQSMPSALGGFMSKLSAVGAICLNAGILNHNSPNLDINIPQNAADYTPTTEITKPNEPKPTTDTSRISSVFFKPNAAQLMAPIENLANDNWFIHCVATGNVSEVQRLLQFNPKLISAKDWTNSNVLIHAVKSGNIDMLVEVLKHPEMNGEKIHEKNNQETSAYSLAKKDYPAMKELFDDWEKTCEFRNNALNNSINK